MARIRTIKPEFPHSESMGAVSRDARLLFILLWTVADDSGRLRGNSRLLSSLLFPYDEDATSLISGWIEELENQNCLVSYEVDNHTYIQITNWHNHQKIDKPSGSKLPEFVESSRIFANDRGTVANVRLRKGKERKGKERNIEDILDSSRLATNPESSPEKKRERFIRPSVSDINEFMNEICYPDPSMNSEIFFDHYEANGWKVGKNPMKDWQATVKNWKRRNFPDAPPPVIQVSSGEPVEGVDFQILPSGETVDMDGRAWSREGWYASRKGS